MTRDPNASEPSVRGSIIGASSNNVSARSRHLSRCCNRCRYGMAYAIFWKEGMLGDLSRLNQRFALILGWRSTSDIIAGKLMLTSPGGLVGVTASTD